MHNHTHVDTHDAYCTHQRTYTQRTVGRLL